MKDNILMGSVVLNPMKAFKFAHRKKMQKNKREILNTIVMTEP